MQTVPGQNCLRDQIDAVAINPSNPNEIVVANGTDQLNESVNGGTSWQGWTNNATLGSSRYPLADCHCTIPVSERLGL